MNQCTDCGVIQTPENSYRRSGKRSHEWQTYCRSCLYERQKARWIARKEQAIEYLGGVCEDCGQAYPRRVMQFHHRDPSTKEGEWRKIRLWAWERVTAELDKCALLCANCHCLRHHEE